MITAIILAAGQSRRMGQPKMLLPWGETSVLGQIIETVQSAGVEHILVVTGGAREQVEEIVRQYAEGRRQYAVSKTQNAEYERGEMLSSVQAGLRALIQPPPSLRDTFAKHTVSAPMFLENGGGREEAAALICLGDQPQVEERCVRAVVEAFEARGSNLVVPSYQMRRGHPWLVARPLWEEILAMSPDESPREFLNRHAGEIQYVNVDTPSILADLDTYDHYLKSRP